jgi:uncharacterized protein YecT (DUF1311 family)
MKRIISIIVFLIVGDFWASAQSEIKDATRDQIKLMSYGFKRNIHSDSAAIKVYLCYDYYSDSVECLEYRVCVRCKFLYSDSIMNRNLSRVVELYSDSKRKKSVLINDQIKWIRKRNIKAKKASNDFKGGTYEMIAFDKSLKDETDERNRFLLKILTDSNNERVHGD